MEPPRGNQAFGAPGIEPRWTHGGKDGVGTAWSMSSRVWFTLWNGIVTEVYYPTVDRPQIRDCQLLITDGRTFFHEEKRHLRSTFERLDGHALGYRCVNADPQGRYRIAKEIITDPRLPCVLQRLRVEGDEAFVRSLHLYALCAPHLEVGGWGNNGSVISVADRKLLVAEKEGTWLVVGASVPFSRLSCGYVGRSDGWTDLAADFRMDWEFPSAPDGNIALTGELDLGGGRECVLGLAFGETRHHAVTTLFQALGIPFEEQRRCFIQQWEDASAGEQPLAKWSGDGGHLYHVSHSLLLAHEDKSYPGAFIASLSIPWGDARGDEDQGGYHLVWTRDMVQSAIGMLAAGDTTTPLRALLYLMTSQGAEGGCPQNFWIDGTPYWRGVQLDEVAFPIMLARRLKEAHALGEVDPYPMVLHGAAYLVRHSPVTEQERWEENSGYSPSTLAATIAALIGAAGFARDRQDEVTARFLEEYADFLERHLEPWTVTTDGSLVAGIRRHFIRILPAAVDDPAAADDPNRAVMTIANRRPGEPFAFPARDIVDAGFLELVRYGIRRADDPLIVDSVAVVDAVLRVDTPYGPCWRRYTHDGYGQRDDGGSYAGWGRGRAWPLLTGERGHYELAAGRDVHPYIRTMERLASEAGMLPEQVWDQPDQPAAHMLLGRPTGSAMPLMWAHAEYIKLLRSAADGAVFDLIPEVAGRYLTPRSAPAREVWQPNRHVRVVGAGQVLRIQAPAPFRLHWSIDEWQTVRDTPSSPTALGIEWVDVPVAVSQRAPVRFTFYWTSDTRWEGRNYLVEVRDREVRSR